ncbi:MAG: carboxymuconolactone decarboxylase family protein [bacterium]|nr:carboxymuconolactone decarboxylase family protein [bacterium]
MNLTADIVRLGDSIESFSPDHHPQERSLCLSAAAICSAEPRLITESFRISSDLGVAEEELYELVLQSYLFLGFPRMLNAAELFVESYPHFQSQEKIGPNSVRETSDWYGRGEELCRKIYDGNFEKLRDRVDSLSPEIFNWMILEGYGKVLSRPKLDLVRRELCIVAFLIMENRAKQLHSHILGAMNAGADREIIRQVALDIGAGAGDGYLAAHRILEQIG